MGTILIIAFFIGLIPAVIAAGKGRSFMGWWIYGGLFFILALPHSLIIKRNEKAIESEKLADGARKCPFCAEIIKAEAIVCRYCGKDLPKEPASQIVSQIEHSEDRELMEKHGITHDGKRYAYRGFRYDKLRDAVRVAIARRGA